MIPPTHSFIPYLVILYFKMRPTQLFTSLYLAQAALAAPILLVAGSSAKAVFIRPARQMSVAETAQIVLKHDSKHHRDASRPSAAWKATPASALDAEGPLTTSELMALSQIPDSTTITTSPSPAELPPQQHHQDDDVSTTHAAKPVTTTTLSSNKGKISVGTLVVPGSSRAKTLMSQLFDSKTPRPYLVPGYYVSSQRADGFVVAIILAFVLVVVAVETWGPVSRTYVEEDPHYLPMAMHAC